MNFFKSVFSDDPDPPEPESESDNASYPLNAPDDDSSPATDSTVTSTDSTVAGSAWNFPGLLQTITSKSESIIEIYRRDLQEFGTGLKKEIEVAHGSLGTVSQAIDQLGSTVVKGTVQIISQGKDAILAVDLDYDNNSKKTEHKRLSDEASFNSKGYCRFDAQLRVVQGDASTYCEDPEDLDEYREWKLGFSFEEKDEEMEGLLRENEAMESIYKKVVPSSVDRESFWFRYYYKVYKLKKAEGVRARLVGSMSREDEDLSWDVEDDEEEEVEKENVSKGKQKSERVIDDYKEAGVGDEKMGREAGPGVKDGNLDEKGGAGTKPLSVEEKHDSGEEGSKVEKRENLQQSKELGNESVLESKVEGSEIVKEVGSGSSTSKEAEKGVGESVNKNDSAVEGSDKKVTMETGVEDGKSSVVAAAAAAAASKPSAHEEDEEDLEWDEIEDLSAMDEKTTRSRSESPSKVDLPKRLTAADEEEDLSWDIDDDDDVVPSKDSDG